MEITGIKSTAYPIRQITGSARHCHWLMIPTCLIFILFNTSFGEEPGSRPEKTEVSTIESIFREMMRTLPVADRKKLEEAEEVMTQVSGEADAENGSAPLGETSNSAGIDAAMASLPTDVQKKVEQIIQQINRRKEERQIELKELKR